MRALAWLCIASASACGRVGFDAVTAATTIDAASDAAHDASATGSVTWVKVFVGQASTTMGLSDAFTTSASQAGDAIVLHVFCESTAQPTGFSINQTSGGAWSFVPLSPITGMTGPNFWGASVGAIAPDTAPAMFTVTWADSAPCTFLDELGDEFTGNDPAGGTATFTAHAQTAMTGNCTATLIAPDANDAVWAACTTNCVSAVGPGYTKGADDAHCDWSEARTTSDPAGTPETPTFTTTAGTAYVMTAATIKPR